MKKIFIGIKYCHIGIDNHIVNILEKVHRFDHIFAKNKSYSVMYS